MPRNRIIILTALLAWQSICFAQHASGIAQYLKPIVSKIAADPNVGGWTWETNGNGGYLLRMDMDVTGDGVSEMFITSSLTSVKNIAEWAVFDVNKDGEIRPYGNSIRIPADSAWTRTEDNTTSLIYLGAPDREREQVSDEKSYPAYRFSFAFPEIEASLTYISEEEAGKLRPADPSQLPRLQAILLADYLTNPDAKWVDVMEWKLDANDCFFRPEDKERAAKNVTFTPQVALSKLGVINSATPSRRKQTAIQQSDTDNSHNTKNSTKVTTPPIPSEESTSTMTWIIIPVLVVAAIVLLWLLLKKVK